MSGSLWAEFVAEDEGSKVKATPYTTMFIALLTLTSLLTTTGVRVNRKRDIILFHEIIDTKQHPRLKSVRLTNNCSYYHSRDSVRDPCPVIVHNS